MAMSFSRIIATGAHSGLGLHALRAFLRNPPASLPPPFHIILYARSTGPASDAQRTVDELDALRLAHSENEGKIELRELDLASLRSVEDAAKKVASELSAEADGQDAFGLGSGSAARSGKGSFDVLFLNAATADAQRTIVRDDRAERADATEYEHTALVNHFAPLVFVARLKDAILRAEDGGAPQSARTRIVFTGSDLHRRIKEPVAARLERHYDARRTMLAAKTDIVGEEVAPDGAFFGSLLQHYGHSKFLQLVGVLELVERLRTARKDDGASTKQIEVLYAQPGFIPNTGLNRQSGVATRLLMHQVMPRLPFKFIASPEQGGEILCHAIGTDLAALPDSLQYPPRALQEQTASSVTFATVIRETAKGPHTGKATRALHDVRGADQDLRKRWWPEAAAL